MTDTRTPAPASHPANLYPYTIASLFRTSLSLLSPSTHPSWSDAHAAAIDLQTLVSEADALYAPLGIGCCKATLFKRRGYGGVPRLPLAPFAAERVEEVEKMEGVRRINEVEERLAKEAQGKAVNGKVNGTNGHAH